MIDSAVRTNLTGPKINESVGQIEAELVSAEKLANVLAEEVSVLAGRIGGFLRPTGPAAANTSARETRIDPSAGRSEAASRLAQSNALIHNAILHIRELHARFDA